MDDVLKVIGLILFLVFASVSLAIRFKLTKFQDRIKKDGKSQRTAINKIIRNTLRMK